jgi:hypothetical protein
VVATINISAFEDTFVIHFGGEFSRINAYTLASSLVALADAAKAANAEINPGYEIEVVVEALGQGSFRTKVRALYRGAGNLFTQDNLKAIVLGVIAAFVYEHTLAPDRSVVVNVTDAEVVIEQGDTRIIVPREVHEAKRQVEEVPQFRQSVGHVIRAAEDDPDVTDFGLSPDEDAEPPIRIPRERFGLISEPLPGGEGRTREIEDITIVRIVRAILQRSKRRWEFVWNGLTIAAPVLDGQFYDDFFAHRITIAPGDALEFKLRIKQRLNPEIGVYLNDSYEVVEVRRHIPRAEQDNLELGRVS